MKFPKQSLAAAVALLAATSGANAAIGVVQVNTTVTTYNGPASLETAVGGSIAGIPISGVIVIPDLGQYEDPDTDNLGDTVVVPFDGSVANGPGINMSADLPGANFRFAGDWARVYNPDFDPSLPECNSWDTGCTLNPRSFWSWGTSHSLVDGEATLTFVDGVPIEFNYTIGRDLLQTYDPHIDPAAMAGLEEISMTISGFELATGVRDNGWQMAGVEFIDYNALNVETTVSAISTSAVPIPAALPLFLGAMGAVGIVARRRKGNGAA